MITSRRILPFGAAVLLASGLAVLAADKPADKPAATPEAAAPAPAAQPAAKMDQDVLGDMMPAARPAIKPLTPAEADAKLSFIPDPAAKSDGYVLAAAELKKLLRPVFAMAAEQGRLPSDEEIRMLARQTAQVLLDQHLLSAECAKDGFKVDADAANKQFETAVASNPMGKEKLDEMLKAQGLTRDDIIQKMATDIMIRNWVKEKIQPTIKVDDAALKKFYEENVARFKSSESFSAAHILIKVDAGADDATKAKAKAAAEQILADLKKGGDFVAIAKEKSDCPSGKAAGGDLGTFEKGQMVPAFEDAMTKLKKDELSGVVETEFGFHIIKGGEHKVAGTRAFEEVKTFIQPYLERRELDTVMQAKIADLRKTAHAEVCLPELPADAAPVELKK